MSEQTKDVSAAKKAVDEILSYLQLQGIQTIEPYVTAEKVQEITGIPVSRIKGWRRNNKIPFRKMNSSDMFKISHINYYIETGRMPDVLGKK